MNDRFAQSAWEEADQRWPDVAWGLVAYAAHLAGRRPAHPVDLYLAGAAGHRLPPAWTAIHIDYGPTVLRWLARGADPRFPPEELWSDLVDKMMGDAPELGHTDAGRPLTKIAGYTGRCALPTYLAVSARRLRIDQQRLRRSSEGSIDASPVEPAGPDPEGDRPPDRLLDDELRAALMRVLTEVFSTLTDQERALARLVCGHGVKKKEAAAMLGISAPTVTRRVAGIEDRLREAILSDRHGLELTPRLHRLWAECLQAAWLKDSPGSSSETGRGAREHRYG